jgi:hypothetical protein
MARNIDPDTRSKLLTRETSGLTLLRGRKLATKTIGLDDHGQPTVTQGYHKQTMFDYRHADAPSITALFVVLKEASRDPNTFAIRGAIREHVNINGKVFARKDINKWGDDAHFEECPRCLVMIDMDGLPVDDIDLINDPEGTATRAIKKHLPDCYQNVSFVWQLSSSAGIGPDNGLLSIHIWFIYDRPVGQDELKAYHALKAPDVDRAVFQTVQVHYIAAPIFEEGLSDHLPRRIGLVKLEKDEVSLPELPPEAMTAAHRTIGQGSTGTVHGFENKLKLIGDGEGFNGFHAPLRDSVASYVYGKYKFEVDVVWLKGRLRDAIDKAPKKVGREKDIKFYTSDDYLDNNIIGSAIAKYCQEVTHPRYLAPTLTADAARHQIKSCMWEAADQHFEALAVWEKSNKRFHDLYEKYVDELKDAATCAGEQLDLKAFKHSALAACREAGLTTPDAMPKAVMSLAVGVGLGKTKQAFGLIKYVKNKALKLLEANAQASKANNLSKPMRIAYKRLTRAVLAVPTHKLADEAVERARKAGLSAGPFRGRLYVDRDTGEFPMCERPDEVQRCIEAGLPVATSMCKSGGAKCQFRQECGYYAQIDKLKNCDVVIVPHASLFHEKPPINSRGLLINDEQFAFDGERQRRALQMSELRKSDDNVYSRGDDGTLSGDAELTARLHHYRDVAAEAVAGSQDGNLSRLDMNGIDVAMVADAIGLEWQTCVQRPVYPGMDRRQFLKALASAASIKRMRLRVDFWNALLVLMSSAGIQKSGWLVKGTDSGGGVVVHVGGRASITEDWFDGLAICLDATSSPELAQLYFAKHKVHAPPAIEAVQANVTVLQTIDKSFSASMCIPEAQLDDDELQRRENRAREVCWFVCLRASEFRGQGVGGVDVLVICQKDLEEYLIDLGLPDNVEITHFNANRGIDRWGSVRCLITIGRTLPSPDAVEVLTENLTGWAVEKLSGGQWYPRQSAGIDVGNGVGLPVQNEQHPDPMVEIVRWQICEAESIQSAGRGRGVNRKTSAPLHLDILTNVCLPFTVDQPMRWDDIKPGRIEEMVGIGLLPEGATAAALVYPDLWPTANSAKMAARAAKARSTGANVLGNLPVQPLNSVKPLLYISSREMTQFSAPATDIPLPDPFDPLVVNWGVNPVAFGALFKMTSAQASVERPKKRALKFRFLFDPAAIPDPENWLSERTGMAVEVALITQPHSQSRQSLRSDSGDEEASAPAGIG